MFYEGLICLQISPAPNTHVGPFAAPALQTALLLSRRLLPRFKGCPRPRLHVSQDRALPRVFRMMIEEVFGQEIRPARMTRAGTQCHLPGHFAVARFTLHGSPRMVRIPLELTVMGGPGIALHAECSRVVGLLFVVAVIVVAHEFLGHFDVDLALVFRHQMFPTNSASVR